MFTHARYIVLDDEESELKALIDALHIAGVPSIGVKFDAPTLPDPALFVGIRILFSDLHLVKAQPAGVQHYNTLASILDRCIPDGHGPYLLVLWTSHEAERAALAARLEEILPANKKPITVLALDKTNLRAGDIWDAEGIREAIRHQIDSIPQLEALLNWERDVLSAANVTLALVNDLIPDNQRTAAAYPSALDRILSILASAAAGPSNAPHDRKGAVTAALSPLLTDRILNQASDPDSTALWNRAVTFQSAATLTLVQKAKMHRMLHLAMPPAEAIAQTDWGAVIPLGTHQITDEAMKSRFGVTVEHLREKEFKLKQTRRGEGNFVAIRAGAACDHAQGNAGPIPILLGLLVPSGALQSGSRSPAIHTCRQEFELEGYAEPVSLLVHARFSTTAVPDELLTWPAASFRLREQLLTTILVHTATYTMRPGTLLF